jgi:signal transduction histidine kinase
MDILIRDSWTLIDITSKLVGKGDLLENLYDMIFILSNELDVNRGSVVLVRPEGDFGLVIASSDNAAIRDLVINLTKYPEIKQVLKKKEPLIVNDVATSQLLEGVLTKLQSMSVASVALFPIIEEDNVLGVIFLRYKQKRILFEQRELIFCKIVANATAIALRNHKIIQTLREKDQQIKQVKSEAETRLAALKSYEDFFMRSVDGMVVTSDSGVVLFVNPKGASILERDEKQIRGVPFSSFFDESQQKVLNNLIEKSEIGEKSSVDLIFVNSHKTDKIILTSAAPLGDGGMTLLILRDVTDERYTAKKLLFAQEQIIKNEKQSAMMEVAGAAAHELNQPLTSVLTSIAMFKRLLKDMPESQFKLLETTEQEIERMAKIIKRLGELTDYSTKSYVGEAKIIDLKEPYNYSYNKAEQDK